MKKWYRFLVLAMAIVVFGCGTDLPENNSNNTNAKFTFPNGFYQLQLQTHGQHEITADAASIIKFEVDEGSTNRTTLYEIKKSNLNFELEIRNSIFDKVDNEGGENCFNSNIYPYDVRTVCLKMRQDGWYFVGTEQFDNPKITIDYLLKPIVLADKEKDIKDYLDKEYKALKTNAKFIEILPLVNKKSEIKRFLEKILGVSLSDASVEIAN